MEEDIANVIQQRRWTVDQLSSEARLLSTKANELPEDIKKNIPIFSQNWSEDGLQQFMELFRESIKNPIRHKNRELLEQLGIQTKGIPEDTFDDSTTINDVTGFLGEIKNAEEVVARLLIEKQLVFGWLKEGASRAKDNLQEILNAKSALKRVASANIDSNIRSELLYRSLSDRHFIDQAESMIGKAVSLQNYGLSVKLNENFEKFVTDLESVSGKCSTLQSEYGTTTTEIKSSLEGKELQEAETLLAIKLAELSQKKNSLLEEWNVYSTTLKSIDHNVPDVPLGIQQLAEGVKELKEECLGALGERGLAILDFLKGKSDFPNEATTDEIKRTLQILRPLFLKMLKEED